MISAQLSCTIYINEYSPKRFTSATNNNCPLRDVTNDCLTEASLWLFVVV